MKKYYDIVIVSGGFDPIHVGHLRMFEEADKRGNTVIVGVNSDEWLKRKKGYVFMPFQERISIIEGFSCVDYVLPFEDSDNTATQLIRDCRSEHPKAKIAFANGGDRGKENTPEQEVCQELNVDMIWEIGGLDKPQSSSWLVNNVLDQLSNVASAVDHPSHYNHGKTEVIDIIAEQGHGKSFCYGNALKYIMRAPHKNNEKEDIEKAIWYLNWLVKNV